jgi:hypothetical protein
MKIKELLLLVFVGVVLLILVLFLLYVKLYVHAGNRGIDVFSSDSIIGLLFSIAIAVVFVVFVSIFRGK